jgi:hypothetical protein
MDELGALILGERPKQTGSDIIAPTKSRNFGKNPQLQPEIEKPDELGQLILGQPTTQTTQTTEPTTTKVSIKNAPSPSYLTQFGRSAASLADIAAGGIMPAVGQVVQAGVRPFTTPQRAEQIGQQIGTAVETQPIGKFFGVTETPEYKQETTRQLSEYVGKHLDKGLDWIAEKTGAPVEDLRNLVATQGLVLGPKVAKPVETGLKLATKPFETAFEVAKNVRIEPVKPTTQPSLVGVGAAKTQANPFKLSGEEAAKGEYPSIKYSKISEDVPQAEQTQRAQIAAEVLGDANQIRPGVLTGNENTLRNEYLTAKTPNPEAGSSADILKRQIVTEQNALSNYAQERIAKTGADTHLISDYQRGERIHDAIAGEGGLRGFFEQEKQRVYNEAKQKVGDNPVQSTKLESLISSPQFKAELKIRKQPDFTSGLQDLLELHKTEGLEGTAPNSIAGLEKLRQSLNKQWSPENAYAIGRAVRMIDEDIANAGGPGLYQQARSLHKAEKTLFESKGIKNIFGEIDPNGIQKGEAFENIPKKLNNIPADQWKHIYDTTDKLASGKLFGPIDPKTGAPEWILDVPPELQMYAKNAKNEIMGSIAREVYQRGAKNAGVWSQKGVHEVLNARAEKIRHAFPLEEQQAFHKLNYAGHLMPGEHGYEGAALQKERLGAIVSRLPTIGREVGALTRIPFAATVLEKGGEKLQARSIASKEAKKAKELSKQMEEAFKKGTKE